MDTHKPTTIVDIARECGVSPTAVSKALNGKGNLRPETVERIKEAARSLNYIPNTFAKSLRMNSSSIIGVIISDTSYSFFSNMIKGLESRAQKDGYDLIFFNTDRVHAREKSAIKLLAGKKISGLVLVASLLTGEEDLAYVRSFNIPFVYILRYPGDPSIDYAANDNVGGSRTITEYLLKTGSRKIHYLSLRHDIGSGRLRLLGYQNALEKYGIPYDPTLVHTAPPTFEAGYTSAKEWLDSGEPIETLLCGCDMMAVGAMRAIIQSGRKIPGDIRLAGYDDIEFAEYLMVPLTTMRQPQYDLGYAGLDILLSRIQQPELPPQHVLLQSELVVRDSA